MGLRPIVKSMFVGAFAAGLVACGGAQPAQPAAPAASAPAGPAVAGVTWTVPGNWAAQPAGGMRVATYTLPAAGGAAAGECAVYYFGPDQGGSVDANVSRWAGQFEGSPQPKMEIRNVGGMKVTVVDVAGTYLSPGGPMMRSQGKMDGWELVGLIVEGPQGPVFFKATGPQATIQAARPAIDALAASLKSQ